VFGCAWSDDTDVGEGVGVGTVAVAVAYGCVYVELGGYLCSVNYGIESLS